MAESDSDLGLRAYWNAKPEVRSLILSHAVRRVESSTGALNSLNQRLSSIVALLFAGAAVSATFTTNGDRVETLPLGLAAASSAVFATGGLASLFGLASLKSAWPGERPSWWLSLGEEALAALDEQAAGYWLAGHYSEVIEGLRRSLNRRGALFNVALAFAAAGGLLICLAAGSAALHPKVPAGAACSCKPIGGTSQPVPQRR